MCAHSLTVRAIQDGIVWWLDGEVTDLITEGVQRRNKTVSALLNRIEGGLKCALHTRKIVRHIEKLQRAEKR